MKEKTLLSGDNAKACIDFLKHSGFPFMLKVSNYTTEIVSELYNMQFLKSMRGKQMFAACAKIKKDIQGKKIPDVDKYGLRYFDHDIKSEMKEAEIVNIDLKSAYATVLYNDKYLTKETYDYLGKIPKLDRLASIGMLASKKHIFNYNEQGQIEKHHKEVSPTENFFYYAVSKVEQIMNELRFICGDAYLFSWVDGIYLKKDLDAIICATDYLDSIDYRFSIEKLTNLNVSLYSKKIKITFNKDGDEKLFNIPLKETRFANDLVNYLLNDKNKQ